MSYDVNLEIPTRNSDYTPERLRATCVRGMGRLICSILNSDSDTTGVVFHEYVAQLRAVEVGMIVLQSTHRMSESGSLSNYGIMAHLYNDAWDRIQLTRPDLALPMQAAGVDRCEGQFSGAPWRMLVRTSLVNDWEGYYNYLERMHCAARVDLVLTDDQRDMCGGGLPSSDFDDLVDIHHPQPGTQRALDDVINWFADAVDNPQDEHGKLRFISDFDIK